MKRFPKELSAAIEPALRAARDVLGDLEPDDVPASLRRVVAHSGPRLTPPLAAKLISELDALDWLREDAAERLAPDAPDAARAFLVRDDGWWADAATAIADARARSLDAEVRALAQKNAKLGSGLEAAKAKLRQQKAEARDRLVALRGEAKALRKRAEHAEGADDRQRRTLEDQIAALEEELDAARVDLAAAEQTLEDLRQRVRRQRRDLADARRELDAGNTASVTRDPLALARQLVLAAASVPRRQRRVDPAAPPAPERSAKLSVPAGVRPDRAEAVDWLLTLSGITVIVDGYNLLFHLEPGEFTSGRARRRLGTLMGHFVRKAKGAPTVQIVFDSALPGSRDLRWAEPGVAVTFADACRLADEVVVLIAAATAGPVVVVSSDREVREASDGVGAVVLWSEAFVEWLTAQPVAMPPSK